MSYGVQQFRVLGPVEGMGMRTELKHLHDLMVSSSVVGEEGLGFKVGGT